MNAPCLLLASGREKDAGRGGGGGGGGGAVGVVDTGFDTGDVIGEDCSEEIGDDAPEEADTGVDGVDLTPVIDTGRTGFVGIPVVLFDSATVAPVS